MKKQLLTLLAVLISASTFAQSTATFKLTPNGFVNANDTSKHFIVFDLPGKSQAELYSASLTYMTSNYVSPKDVISKVENEVLTVNGYEPGAIKNTSLQTPFDMNYTVVFKFKDGKIKVEDPTFRLTVGARTLYLVYPGFSINGQDVGIYGKNGKIKSERAIGDLEKFFNKYIAKYIQGITKGNITDW